MSKNKQKTAERREPLVIYEWAPPEMLKAPTYFTAYALEK